MDFTVTKNDQANVEFSLNDVRVITQALNEVCNGLDLFDFETRMGADRNCVSRLLSEFTYLRNEMKKSID